MCEGLLCSAVAVAMAITVALTGFYTSWQGNTELTTALQPPNQTFCDAVRHVDLPATDAVLANLREAREKRLSSFGHAGTDSSDTASPALTLTVDPSSQQAPPAGGNTATFTSVAEAVAFAAKQRAALPAGPIVIDLRASIHHVPTPIVIPKPLSSKANPLVFRGAGPNATVLSGGKQHSFTRQSGRGGHRFYEARLTAEDLPSAGNGMVWQTWAVNAEEPKRRLLRAQSFLVETKKTNFSVNASSDIEVSKNAHAFFPATDATELASDTFVQLLLVWSSAWFTAASWRAADGVVTTTASTAFDAAVTTTGFAFSGNRGFVLNVRSAAEEGGTSTLDASALAVPGTFIVIRDKPAGSKGATLRYTPTSAELATDPESVDLVVATAPTLFDLQGSEHVQFDGIGFQHTAAPLEQCLPEACDGQAGSLFASAALSFSATKHIRVSNCAFDNLGGWGVMVRGHAIETTVVDSTFTDLGAGAVRVGAVLNYHQENSSYVLPNGEFRRDYPSGVIISNNAIRDTGRLLLSAAVLVQEAVGVAVIHNTIARSAYSAVSLGWVWSYAPTPSGGHTVAYNVITETGATHINEAIGCGDCAAVVDTWRNPHPLSDLGCVYMLGANPGTMVTANYFSGTRSFLYGGSGLYSDEGVADVRVFDNLITNISGFGVHHHYGLRNAIINNVISNMVRTPSQWLGSNMDSVGFAATQSVFVPKVGQNVSVPKPYNSSCTVKQNAFLLRSHTWKPASKWLSLATGAWHTVIWRSRVNVFAPSLDFSLDDITRPYMLMPLVQSETTYRNLTIDCNRYAKDRAGMFLFPNTWRVGNGAFCYVNYFLGPPLGGVISIGFSAARGVFFVVESALSLIPLYKARDAALSKLRQWEWLADETEMVNTIFKLVTPGHVGFGPFPQDVCWSPSTFRTWQLGEPPGCNGGNCTTSPPPFMMKDVHSAVTTTDRGDWPAQLESAAAVNDLARRVEAGDAYSYFDPLPPATIAKIGRRH